MISRRRRRVTVVYSITRTPRIIRESAIRLFSKFDIRYNTQRKVLKIAINNVIGNLLFLASGLEPRESLIPTRFVNIFTVHFSSGRTNLIVFTAKASNIGNLFLNIFLLSSLL